MHKRDEREAYECTLESLANLLYLARRADPHSPQQSRYFDLAELVLNRERERDPSEGEAEEPKA